MTRTILVTGGCGYIGSHTILELIENNYRVICVDNNVRSSSDILKKIENYTGKPITFYNTDVTDFERLENILKHEKIDGIIHFAAYKSVVESVSNPMMYYHNNITGLINVLRFSEKYNIKQFVFSSSCTVYGIPDSVPVSEETHLKPAECPYGFTKQMGEQIVKDSKIQSCILRYFNPAGAHPSMCVGEDIRMGIQSLTSAIVSNALENKTLSIFGSDYPTKDGTCVRDFIHVCDIANAHVKAIDYMNTTTDKVSIFNLGSGKPITVLQAVTAFLEFSTVEYTMSGRRPGDVGIIYSDNRLAMQKLKWNIRYDIRDIMKTAWDYSLSVYHNTVETTRERRYSHSENQSLEKSTSECHPVLCNQVQ